MLSLYNFLKVKLCYRTYWKQWLAFLTMCFLVFGCSSDDDNGQSLRNYLTSNAFLSPSNSADNIVIYEPVLEEGGLFRRYDFRFNSFGLPCASDTDLTYEECYRDQPCAEPYALLTSESNEQIVYSFSNSSSEMILRRQGDDMRMIVTNNGGTSDVIWTFISQADLDEYKALRNNTPCPCNWDCN